MNRIRMGCVMALAAALLLAGCLDTDTSDGDASVQVSALSVSAEMPVLTVLGEMLLTATALYEDGSTEDISDTVTWASSDPDVASVSAAGVVSGVAGGNATFTATDPDSGAAGSVTVEVTAATLDSIAVTPATVSILLGQSVQLTATGTYSDASTVDLTTYVDWTTPGSLISVGDGGVVLGLSLGSTTVTATDPVDGVSDSATVDVVSSL